MAKKKSTANPASTEVDAYIFIKSALKSLGWDTRNPEKIANGQVWTQNECLSNAEIRKMFGLNRPENIVKITEKVLWIIEAKRTHGELSLALSEAEDYAAQLNKSQIYKAAFVTGVAGNEHDSFLIRTRFLKGGKSLPVCMNGAEVTGLLTPENCEHILHTGAANIENPPIDERLFIARAERINEILHLGAVNPHERGTVLSALLLSKLSSTGPNIEEKDSTILIQDINNRVRSVLIQQKKARIRGIHPHHPAGFHGQPLQVSQGAG